MPPPRPKGSGYTTGVTPARPSSNTPMSERQQMALLIQMTATSSTDTSRVHSKKNDTKKDSEVDENTTNEKQDVIDAKEKPAVDDSSADIKKDTHLEQSASTAKRNFSDIEEEYEETGDELKKKKRKDSDNSKDSKNSSNKVSSRFDKNSKLGSAKGSPSGSKINTAVLEKEQTEITKSVDFENETDGSEDYKSNDSLYNGGLKVPPLKIVIPQQNCSIDTDGNVLRTGKIAASRNAALPYVVSSNSDSIDNLLANQCVSPHDSPHKVNVVCSNVLEDKNNKLCNDEKNLRVLRSSHRSGVACAERSSNNSSPQMQSSSPSPSSNHANDATELKLSYSNMTSSPLQPNQQFDHEAIPNVPSPSTSSTSSSKEIHSSSTVDLHPRKRKIRPKNISDDAIKNSNVTINTNADSSTSPGETHPHDYPFTNGFQMFLNIRRQIEKKWKHLYPVKPGPPPGYNDYLLMKRSYLLNNTSRVWDEKIPDAIPLNMRDIFLSQERARRELTEKHTVEREKLCLNVEQEIIRVHSKAARSISGQSVPYSVCTYLKDDEVYNMMTPEQDEKEKSERCRFNRRLLLSWLQDVDDKWEKIKESMVLRHHNEAESLHAVQILDWNIYLKRQNLCDCTMETNFDKDHIPIIYVGDDFDLLPA